MSFLKKLFGKKKKEKSSDQIELSWIPETENPWGHKILDLRPFSQTMISTSENKEMATNAISYNAENGTSFFGQKPVNEKTIKANLSFKTDKILYPGVLFTPNTMEHKWALYFDGEFLIFVRSWLREILVVAKTTQKENELIVETITGEFTEDESPEFTKAILNFILISHSIGEIVPALLPIEFQNDTTIACHWAFSTYGNMAQLGVFDEQFLPTSNLPLRSHSLLHIAVAQGEIKEIETEFKKGVNLNALAGDGLAPLHWSMVADGIESMAKLLELGADPNSRTNEGATPIMNAVQSNKIEKLNLLIKSGGLINLQDNRGFTALHRACEMGNIAIVKILLENGADKSISAEGHTALSLAIMTKQNEIIELLK
ncbi:ankyrin repeat domain-containing protein [Flavobacterium sp. ALJ2]|uniref:ankyrin repeat domain-containing protein n=1 Tax=Flavobacterium sp. ALJ2 TaxID=2786960 RepID=UPI00189D530A|nr:ankyrin repeat domain-containing protein [Flavobacterium sp. ALJ2]MBF7090838.1 ankyrin repeat domain-containing protein [Flavobacterium sp. ALJ2]